MNINSKEREYTANSTLTRRRTQAKKRQDLYVLNWKSSYDVMLFIYQSHEQHFAEF
jgi:hypothetical protein